MAVTYEQRLRGRENQVLKELARDGMAKVMERYSIKKHRPFAKWVRRHQQWIERDQQPELKKVLGMQGGEKALFCRNHRDTILDCLEIFGEAFVLDRFNIGSRDTLDGIISGLNEPFSRKLTRADRVELKANEALSTLKAIRERLDKIEGKLSIHDAEIAEDRGKINELISLFKKFSENVSSTVARTLVEPLIQRVIQSGCNLDDMKLDWKDPLELDIVTDSEPPIPPPASSLEPEIEKLRETYMASHPMSKE